MAPKSFVAKVKYEDTVEAQSQAVLKGPRTLGGEGGALDLMGFRGTGFKTLWQTRWAVYHWGWKVRRFVTRTNKNR